ncbi:MAG: FlgO family outer membrane protein, partial [Kiloniellales bacterium]|nr:FlgO family outer membrane protein [Kiloniellales bacterium]
KDYVRRLRDVLSDDAQEPRFIETARGLGYRLVGDIVVMKDGAAPAVPALRDSLPAVAVLPFADRSETADQAYLAAGVAEDIMAELARFRSLVVIARDSSFLHGAEPPDMESLARALQVDYLVMGTLRRAGERVRIAARLVACRDGRCVWAERYDSPLADIFAVQDDVARAVTAKIVGHIDELGRQRAARKRPETLAVYELLLLGNWHLREGSENDVAEARRLFQRAIDLDPTNARAHAEMAFSHLIEFWSDWTADPAQAAREALSLARMATRLDDLDARAHLYLATAHYYAASNFEAASAEFDRATELNPNDYDVFCLRSWLLALSGRAEEGIACAEHAIRLSPLTTEDCRVAQSCAAYGARRYGEALAALRSIPEPSNHVRAFLAVCHAQLGQHAEAEKAMADFLAVAAEDLVDHPDRHPAGWRGYWATRYPFKHAEDLEHLLDGLAKAGMPIAPPSGGT